MEGDLDEANRLIQHVRDNHLDEPGVAERLYGLLHALGAIPDEATRGPAGPAGAGAPPAAAPAESALWTPGGDEPAPSGGSQKIWTPS